MEEQMESELRSVAQAQAQRLSANLSSLWRIVEMIADEASAHPDALQQTLIDARRFNPALTLLGLAKVDGTVTAATDGEETSVAQAPWFASAVRSPIVRAASPEAGSYSATLVLAKPVRTKEGQTVAVLFALAPLNDLVASSAGGWQGESILAANDGHRLIGWENAAPSAASASSARARDRGEWLAATAQATSGGAFPDTGWSLTVARSKTEVDRRLAPMLWKLWAGCFAMACFTLIAVAAWTAWLAAPLKELALFAAAASNGRLVNPIRESRFREAAVLSSALVKLCTSLRRMNAPHTFRIVATEAEVDGERDLIFDDLVLHINALMDEECQMPVEL